MKKGKKFGNLYEIQRSSRCFFKADVKKKKKTFDLSTSRLVLSGIICLPSTKATTADLTIQTKNDKVADNLAQDKKKSDDSNRRVIKPLRYRLKKDVKPQD
ncbi:hypothetical protein ABG067_008564, partial [Albugo candida]